jgi:hypothetical protein
MAKTSALPTPDPLPAEGGSYLLDPQTGKWELLSRTEPATPDAAKPATTDAAQPPTDPEPAAADLDTY